MPHTHQVDSFRQLTLSYLEARLLYKGGDEEADMHYEQTFHAFSSALERLNHQELLAAVQDITDVAWDLADSWAGAGRSVEPPLNNIRNGNTRGW